MQQIVLKYPRSKEGLQRRFRWGETVVQGLLFFSGIFSIFTTIGIVYELGKEALLFFREPAVTLWAFLTGTEWQPHIEKFGILPLFGSTLMTSLIAMSIAIPLGMGVAIYMSEYASTKVRNILKPTLEMLAGIPTIVYGYFALTFMTPLLRNIFGRDTVDIYNMTSAGLVMGILILPLIASMTEDALSAVPRSLREAGYGLGGTKLEVALKIVVPAAISGISAAIIVGISRAIGETMIVVMAAGLAANLTANPFEAVTTVTVQIVTLLVGDQEFDSAKTLAAFALGLVLFVVTLGLNVVGLKVVRKYREQYD
ncbi:MAG TPA: phosphate ABC transporter permease subunit PstC [Anaerolineae bacterium]|nr:phosphate ABC transporter permease subunit PstC [Anaerolineae bacterium]